MDIMWDLGRREREEGVKMSAPMPFWRAAGMTYITYSNICANLVRNCLKEPHKAEALNREKVHFAISTWKDGKAEKPVIRSDLAED
ncbi:ATP synthase subunit epsilon, mitochondrial [Eucalyptus grandis]|nr:ATP synthase subunit epsilon, mitochondrial [Eucalyptus grandis]